MESSLHLLSRAASLVENNSIDARINKELPTTKWKRDRRTRLSMEYHQQHSPSLNSSLSPNSTSSSSSSSSSCSSSSPAIHATNNDGVAGSIQKRSLCTERNDNMELEIPIDMSVNAIKQRLPPPPPYREPLPGSQFIALARPSVITQAPKRKTPPLLLPIVRSCNNNNNNNNTNNSTNTNSNNNNHQSKYQGSNGFSANSKECKKEKIESISMIDPVIDEHFRRSLGSAYLTVFGSGSNNGNISNINNSSSNSSSSSSSNGISSSVGANKNITNNSNINNNNQNNDKLINKRRDVIHQLSVINNKNNQMKNIQKIISKSNKKSINQLIINGARKPNNVNIYKSNGLPSTSANINNNNNNNNQYDQDDQCINDDDVDDDDGDDDYDDDKHDNIDDDYNITNDVVDNAANPNNNSDDHATIDEVDNHNNDDTDINVDGDDDDNEDDDDDDDDDVDDAEDDDDDDDGDDTVVDDYVRCGPTTGTVKNSVPTQNIGNRLSKNNLNKNKFNIKCTNIIKPKTIITIINPPETIDMSVDDHFAKALGGDTWKKLKASQ